jgi:transcriptional regulator with XRE-family HTH domain
MDNIDSKRDLSLRIGVAVRRYREHAALTQAQLAEKADVAQSEISMIEGGKRSSLKTLDEVARASGRRLSDMIRFAEDVGTTQEVAAEARAFVRDARTKQKKSTADA